MSWEFKFKIDFESQILYVKKADFRGDVYK